jgi:hypothetical protein
VKPCLAVVAQGAAYDRYYQTRRCVTALMESASGHQVWQMPAVVEDLVELVYNATGILVTPPEQR